jgi:maleate cis-trans isomerase
MSSGPALEPWYRLGFITPHPVVDNAPYQFYRLAPPGVMLVLANLELGDYTAEAVEHELPQFWYQLDALLRRKVDRVVLNGVPVSAALGRERVLALIDEASARAGLPVDTDFEALIAAMRHLNVTRVALATRWHEDLNQAVARYLGQGGIEVVGTHSSGRSMAENEAISDEEGMRLAVELGREALAAPEAQGLLLPGGRWISIHAIPLLEAEFGKPIFLNLNAALWAALRGSAQRQPIEGWGRLLASL